MEKKVFTKQDEIKALRALVEMDGYFADAFGEDIETIVSNIKNDFAFEASTKLDTRIGSLTDEIRELKAGHAKKISDICEDLLYVYAQTDDDRLYDIVLRQLGRKGLIMKKRTMGIALNEKEIDYLISNIK
jgi:uncharacterized small protein (DUF1192 family)